MAYKKNTVFSRYLDRVKTPKINDLIIMKWFLFASMIFCCTLVYGQKQSWRVTDKAAIAGYIIQPDFKLSYDTTGKKKKLYYKFIFDDGFFHLGDTVVNTIAHNYNEFILSFVLADSIHYYDLVHIEFYDLYGKFRHAWDCEISDKSKIKKVSLKDRAQALGSILPFPCNYTFVERKNGQTDIFYELIINQWVHSKNIYTVSVYSQGLARVIYDYIIQNNKRKYFNIYILFEDGKGKILKKDLYKVNSNFFKWMYNVELYK